jgi:hypothetical protein
VRAGPLVYEAMLPLALLHHLRLAGEPIDERQGKRIADQFFTTRPGHPANPRLGVQGRTA